VPTQENPADLLSRGLYPRQLVREKIWWYGPPFLLKSEHEWSTTPKAETPTTELKKIVCAVKQVQLVKTFIFDISTNLRRIIRIVAYCKRFITNCKNRSKGESIHLKAAELRDSLLNLARLAQKESFPTEIQMLARNELITRGKLASLNVFIDQDGLVRVGGRLRNSEFSTDKKYPIVLSADHTFTKLLFVSEYLTLLHAGPQLLLSSIREQFWPLGGRNLARKIVHNCVKCFRAKPRQPHMLMGELPKSRVSIIAPFYNTGVDYADL